METPPVDEKLETIYQDIIGNLITIPDHRPKGIRSPPLSSLFSLINPELTSEHMISLVRERVNQQLSGSEETDSNMRKKLVKLFCIKISKHKCVDYVDLWPFFDSVLDETFKELETHVVFPGAQPNANLISIIAKRSPYLNKLKLNFIRYYSTSGKERISLIPSLHGLNSLHHLTSLTLFYLDGCYNHSILALIGKHCSSLTHLRLAKTNFVSKYAILAIMLGELIDKLIGPLEHHPEELCWRFKKVDWTKDAALARLRVPPEFLTSLCFTLRFLEVSEYAHQRFYSAIDPEIAAFILRHMPNLEVLESCTGTEKAIHLLRKETEEAERSLIGPIQQGFEQSCRDAVNLHGLALRNPRELVDRPFSAFSGTLSLTKLEYVYLNDKNIADMLHVIGLSCPKLKEATFGEKKKGEAKGVRSTHSQSPSFLDSKEVEWMRTQHYGYQQLELDLSKWPKLEAITFVKVSPANIQAILNVFHKELKEISFIECNLINLADLERCTQLESLYISNTCSLDSYENVPALSADTFLPNLKNFSSKICLGNVSSLFEEKTTLNRLLLKCCHMDIQECIQQKWRSLEMLHLQRCSGLEDMATVSFLIDQLVDVKELFLPYCLTYNDPNNLVRAILKKAINKKPTPLDIRFKFREDVRCLLNPMIDVDDNMPVYHPREVVDSPPSHRSDESPVYSYCSSYGSNPKESSDGEFFDSE